MVLLVSQPDLVARNRVGREASQVQEGLYMLGRDDNQNAGALVSDGRRSDADSKFGHPAVVMLMMTETFGCFYSQVFWNEKMNSAISARFEFEEGRLVFCFIYSRTNVAIPRFSCFGKQKSTQARTGTTMRFFSCLAGTMI
jgi:hypothetical protein